MKIKNKVVLNILEECTSKEIDFLFYIGQFQDDNGYIKGIYYQNAVKALNISKTTFYNIIESLSDKDIIDVDYSNNGGSYALWTFSIKDNLFVTKNQYKEGYLNLNHNLFHRDDFKKLPKTAKIIAVRILMRNQNRREIISVMFDDLLDWTSRTKQSVNNAVKLLSKIFNLTVFKNRIEIKVDERFYRRSEHEKDVFNEHAVKTILIENGFEDRRNCSPDEKALIDTCKVIQQYNKLNQEKVFGIIKDSLRFTGKLNPKYINKVLSIIYRNIRKKQYNVAA